MPSLWTVILRCHGCEGKFTIRRLSLDRVAAICMVTPCPHCGIHPQIAPSPLSNEHSNLHRIFDLREETPVAHRKRAGGDTWHFDETCSQWPDRDYVEVNFPPKIEEVCNECKTNPLKKAEK